MPDQQAANLRELRARGLGAAMVGDGVRDAPALDEADLGFAIAAGAGIGTGFVMTPAISAVFMSLSTIVVAINAQLLRRYRTGRCLTHAMQAVRIPRQKERNHDRGRDGKDQHPLPCAAQSVQQKGGQQDDQRKLKAGKDIAVGTGIPVTDRTAKHPVGQGPELAARIIGVGQEIRERV